jgi:aryl-alcohol dehydrogenase-like predicted oxidoreductase
MHYRKLGNTDLEISLIGLGTMTWGEQNTLEQAMEQLDIAFEKGINFIDTAELYPVPPHPKTQGLTEQYIGIWLQQKNIREQIILASKVAGPGIFHIRDGKSRLNKKNITQALEDSLIRLKTDYLDLYQVHWPDRKANFFGKLGYLYLPDAEDTVTIQETLSILASFVKAGKIRHIGISNETPWGTMQYLTQAQQHHYPKIVSIQNPYNLLNRSFEIGLSEFSHREQIGLLAYSPLGFGVLSGKYLNHQKQPNARLNLPKFSGYTRYFSVQGIAATQAYVNLAYEHRIKPAQLALAFIHSRPFTSSTIIGATDTLQLIENINSIETVLNKDILTKIEQIHELYSNPCP